LLKMPGLLRRHVPHPNAVSWNPSLIARVFAW
jgi:hypothetical protein